MLTANRGKQWLDPVLIFMISSLMFACGGGGGSDANQPISPVNPPAVTDFSQGVFRSASLYQNSCQTPRGAGYDDVAGNTEDENNFLRAWSHDLYLWYDEIVDADPADYSTPDYFDLMKTDAVTPSGAPQDQYHFTYDSEAWEQLSQSGVQSGYGVDWILISPTTPREILAGFIEPGSPAQNAGLTRGMRVLEVDGVDAVNGSSTSDVTTLNTALFPAASGETYTFEVEEFDGTNARLLTLTSATITQDPVPVTQLFNTSAGTVGYLLFNAHIATAEASLVQAMRQFELAGVSELVVDLRYNGGGFLDIANELGYMIAGPAAAAGRVFDEIIFNDKHSAINPITGASLVPTNFHTTTQGFSINPGSSLPSVNLSRVFILTGDGTCSASEALINGLRGIDVEVRLIGDATCGKPFGFYPQDNCGTTYFSIQFQGINAKGFGDYADGFVPTKTPVNPHEVLGCSVADDFSHALGQRQEARLAAALAYIETGSCPVVAATTRALATKTRRVTAPKGQLTKPTIPGMVMPTR
jgi:carboxyl-terminal processing protease